jgi:uncharacterized protein DUF1330
LIKYAFRRYFLPKSDVRYKGNSRRMERQSIGRGLVMPKEYWIVSVEFSNPESYKHYIAENRNAFRKYGARFLIRGGKSEVVEGAGRTRI